jgi:drug/metabolite transporter (DMT)-like permease
MGVFFVIIDYLLYGYHPSLLKICGMIAAILGAAWILTGDMLIQREGQKGSLEEPLNG